MTAKQKHQQALPLHLVGPQGKDSDGSAPSVDTEAFPTVPYLRLPDASTWSSCSVPFEQEIQPGTVLDEEFQIVRRLGEGAIAQIYLARHVDRKSGLQRDVAIKVLHSCYAKDPNQRRKMELEARVLNALDGHPNIVRIWKTSISEHITWTAMEWLEGGTLRQELFNKKSLSLPECMAIMKAVCAGVQYAHEKGIAHGDLKPENIVISRHGPKVLDFGAARLLCGDPSRPDEPAFASGTPAYMAPEAFQKEHRPDVPGDIYALSAIFCEMFAGTHVFALGSEVPDSEQLIWRQLFLEPRMPAGLPVEHGRVLLQGLAKHPRSRPQSVRELWERLEKADVAASARLAASAAAESTGLVGKTWPRRVVPMSTLGAFVGVMVGTVGFLAAHNYSGVPTASGTSVRSVSPVQSAVSSETRNFVQTEALPEKISDDLGKSIRVEPFLPGSSSPVPLALSSETAKVRPSAAALTSPPRATSVPSADSPAPSRGGRHPIANPRQLEVPNELPF